MVTPLLTPDTGGNGFSHVFDEFPWDPAQCALDPIGKAGIATVLDFAEEIAQ